MGNQPMRRCGRVLRWMTIAGVAAVLGAACTAGDDAASGTPTTATGDQGPIASGPAPGVTEDTVRVGVTYADAEALAAVGLTFDFGDVEGAYSALADAINEEGGIQGRRLELVFAPIDPTGPSPADRACVRLTEDEDVFVVTGFFLADAVLCPVAVHDTAVLGGQMTADRLEQAAAPWLTPDHDAGFIEDVTRKLADEGLLDGTVAVMAATGTGADLDLVEGVLADEGIEPVETAIMDAPPTDPVAVQNSVRTIAERFESSGADTVLLVGGGGTNWLSVMADDPSYRPALRFTELAAVTAFTGSAETGDTSLLSGAASGGAYGPAQAVYEEPTMQDCIAEVEAGGVEVPAPDDVGGDDESNIPYSAGFLACGNLVTLQAWLDAAGEDLGYGTLQAAIDDTFEVQVPGEPEPRTFGPPPAADGDPPAYLYLWDDDAGEMVIQED